MRTFWRYACRALLGLIGLLLLISIALLAKSEWEYRSNVPLPRTVFQPLPGGPAPVLILLHGAGLNGHMWDAVRRDLDPRWRVIAPDLPGNGSRRGELFTLDAAVATVADAARSVAPAPVILVGDSLGGYTAMAAASAIPPEQLRGLVIGGSAGNFSYTQLPAYVGNVILVKGLLAFMDEQQLLAKGIGRFGLNEADGRAVIAAGASMRAVPPAVRELMSVDFRAKLAAIPQPVLIVNGTLDTRSIAGEPDFLAAAQHGSNYHFENTEHGVSMRRAEEFARVVNEFAAHNFPAEP